MAMMLACASHVARAEPPDDASRNVARSLGEEGIRLFDAGDYGGALAKFDRAFTLVQVPTLALRSGVCLEKLGRFVEATERYLRASTTEIEGSAPTNYREVQRQAQEEAASRRAALLPRLSHVVVDPRGAAPPVVLLDAKPLALALIGADVPVDPGPHHIDARAPDAVGSFDVVLREGETKHVALELVPFMTPSNHAEAPRHTDDAAKLRRTIGFVGIVAGGASLVAGGVTLALAAGKASTLESTCPNRTCKTSDLGADGLATYDAYGSLRTASTVTFIAGGVLAGAGLVLVLSGRSNGSGRAWVGPRGVGLAASF